MLDENEASSYTFDLFFTTFLSSFMHQEMKCLFKESENNIKILSRDNIQPQFKLKK